MNRYEAYHHCIHALLFDWFGLFLNLGLCDSLNPCSHFHSCANKSQFDQARLGLAVMEPLGTQCFWWNF